MKNMDTEDLKMRQLSNTENYDKVVLTLSSTGLMFSIAIVNFINGTVVGLYCLYFAWVFFIVSVSTLLLSFITGNKAVEHKYLGNDSSSNKYSKWTKCLNIIAGVLLILAFIMITIFAYFNIN